MFPWYFSFRIFCKYGTVLFFNRPVSAAKTWNLSSFLVPIQWACSSKGNKCFICSKYKHFFPKLYKSNSLLWESVGILNTEIAFSYDMYLSFEMFLNAFFWTLSKLLLSSSVRVSDEAVWWKAPATPGLLIIYHFITKYLFCFTALPCSVMHYTLLHYTSLQCNAVHFCYTAHPCSVMQFTLLHYTSLQCNAVHFVTLHILAV